MSISDFYMSVGQKRNISHFANIVRIAKSDGNLCDEEFILLQQVAKRFDISESKFEEIFKHPENFRTISEIENEERIDRLFDLVKMLFIDHISKPTEVCALKKIITGLGFQTKKVDEIVNKAIELSIEGCSREKFQREIIVIEKLKKAH